MAENEAGATGNGGTLEQQLIINAQYVKDFSFENPRAPQSLMPQKDAPEIKLDVDVKAQNLGPGVYEVMLSIQANATRGADPVFVIEVTYSAVVTLQNVPPEQTAFLLLVETPRLIFPFARAVVADATRDGGFPPLFVHPIDFAELLRRQQQQQGVVGNA